MTDTDHIINTLAQGATPVTPLAMPSLLFGRLVLLLLVYVCIVLVVMGHRDDLALQLYRPRFIAELSLLVLIALSAVWTNVHLAFPDQYQHRFHMRTPLIAAAAFLLLLLWEWVQPNDAHMFLPEALTHHMICTLCIVGVALLPSASMYWLMRQGATLHARVAGMYSVLSATAIGCLAMRLIEKNDDILHLLTYHYAPALVFSLMGTMIGRRLFKW